jgi:hypothetical protein
MIKIYWIALFLTILSSANGQETINLGYRLAFVYYEDHDKNLILIPNMGKFYSFKVYHKTKNETEYEFVGEARKPRLPFGYSFPYQVKLADTKFHSREIDYKILAFDKSGREICEMKVIWDEEKFYP